MAVEIKLPVYVRVGDTEGPWGELTIEAESADGSISEEQIRRQTAAFFREAADRLENPAADDEEPT